MRRNVFRNLRIAVLFFVLANVVVGAWATRVRTTGWHRPLSVTVHAINGDDSAASAAYIDRLLAMDEVQVDEFFGDIERFFTREGGRYALPGEEPVDIIFAGVRDALPPAPPRQGSVLAIMTWSLRLRFWSWRHDDYDALQDGEIFVIYFDPERSRTLSHSLGLQQGLIGVVNAFAAPHMAAENHVVIAHELLHMVGASDKYDPASNAPLVPDGLADPHREPLYPQRQAEIMAGRIALGPRALEAPRSLDQVVVGGVTAREIGWID